MNSELLNSDSAAGDDAMKVKVGHQQTRQVVIRIKHCMKEEHGLMTGCKLTSKKS